MESKDKKRKPFTILDLLKKEQPDSLLEKLVDQAEPRYQIGFLQSHNGDKTFSITTIGERINTIEDLDARHLSALLEMMRSKGVDEGIVDVRVNDLYYSRSVSHLQHLLAELLEPAKQAKEYKVDLKKSDNVTVSTEAEGVFNVENRINTLADEVKQLRAFTTKEIKETGDYVMNLDRRFTELTEKALRQVTENGVDKLEEGLVPQVENLEKTVDAVEHLLRLLNKEIEKCKEVSANYRNNTNTSFQKLNNRISKLNNDLEALEAIVLGDKEKGLNGLAYRVAVLEENSLATPTPVKDSAALGWLDFGKLQDFNVLQGVDGKIYEIPKQYTNKDGHRVTITEEVCRQILEYLEGEPSSVNVTLTKEEVFDQRYSDLEEALGKLDVKLHNYQGHISNQMEELLEITKRRMEQAMDRPVNKILEVEKRFENLDQLNQANFNTIEKVLKTMSEKVDKLRAEVDMLEQDKQKSTRIKKQDSSLSPTLQKIYEELAEAASNSMKS